MNIKLALTAKEREQVYQLRYQVYVEEMGLNPKEADHSRGLLVDPLDEAGWILAAFAGSEVVGTVRTNLASDPAVGAWCARLGMDRLGTFFPDHVSMTTRLVVAPRCRNGTLGIRLSKAAFRLQYGKGTRFDAICCHTRQVPLFHRMGYRSVMPGFELEGYGHSHPLLLCMSDSAHMASVGSPFLTDLPPGRDELGSVDFYYESVCRAPWRRDLLAAGVNLPQGEVIRERSTAIV